MTGGLNGADTDWLISEVGQAYSMLEAGQGELTALRSQLSTAEKSKQYLYEQFKKQDDMVVKIALKWKETEAELSAVTGERDRYREALKRVESGEIGVEPFPCRDLGRTEMMCLAQTALHPATEAPK